MTWRGNSLLTNVLSPSFKQAYVSLHRVAKQSGRKREREADGKRERGVESRDEMKKTGGEREERNGGTKDRWRKKERGSRMKAHKKCGNIPSVMFFCCFLQQKCMKDTLYAIDYDKWTAILAGPWDCTKAHMDSANTKFFKNLAYWHANSCLLSGHTICFVGYLVINQSIEHTDISTWWRYWMKSSDQQIHYISFRIFANICRKWGP